MFLVGNQREYLILNLIHYILLYIHYIHRIKLPEYRIGIKFDKDSLAVEKKNSYLNKIVNVYLPMV